MRSGRPTSRLVALAVVCGAAIGGTPPSDAPAATWVSVFSEAQGVWEVDAVASAGQRNAIVVWKESASTFVIWDDAGVTIGDRCSQISPRKARCTFPPLPPFYRRLLLVETHDGDDVVETKVPDNTVVLGGAGNDRLVGGPGFNVLFGDGGRDIIDGKGGPDILAEPFGPNGPDELHGGAGVDEVMYGLPVVDPFDPGPFPILRNTPVVVDIDDVADDGAPGEGDNVHTSVENVTGTNAADVLRGHQAANRLQGGPGDDTLEGLAQRDIYLGDEGDDTIRARAGDRDAAISCGADGDVVTADADDPADPDCEVVDRP
jgi:Ca2+-binding RTX toxin-like protein